MVLDIDGVLTDGRMGYSAGDEVKFFNAHDGHGIKMLMRAGSKSGLFPADRLKPTVNVRLNLVLISFMRIKKIRKKLSRFFLRKIL